MQWSKCVSTGNMAISVLITGTTEKQMWFAEVMLASNGSHTMVAILCPCEYNYVF